MLEAEGLLAALSENEDIENFKDRNDDHDFGKVLEFYGNDTKSNYEVMCSDGKKRELLFDN